MNKKPAARTAATTAPRQVRQTITFELVQRLAPHAALADNLARTFALPEIDAPELRERSEEAIGKLGHTLAAVMNEKAVEIAMQRIVGSIVASAHGAAQFYGSKVTQAKDLTMSSQNDSRDDDRDGGAGFDSKAQRARIFAAETGLQAFALMTAAEGALSAYEHIVGQPWKAYEAPAPAPSSVARKSAAEELAALGMG